MEGRIKFALYPGCTVESEQYAHEISAREIFPKLGVKLIDVKGFSCCGHPIKNVSVPAWLYLAARNLALAEKLGLDILPLCNGCNLSFREANHYLEENHSLKERIKLLLSSEGLSYTGNTKSWHILEFLRDIVGVEKIRSVVNRPLKGLKLAAHYGCHAIRPSNIGMFDDPENPRSLEELIEALGAEADDYPERLDCCGQGLAITTGKTALTIAGLKLKAIQDRGFDAVILVCPFCMKMFDAKQNAIRVATQQKDINLPVLYYTQLLGLAMGIEAEKLGINLNLSPVGEILKKLEGK
jgi:heterodisulfide reductase subunit B